MIPEMQIKFLSSDYQDLYDGKIRMNFHPNLIESFKKRVQIISYTEKVNDLYNIGSLHLEKLKGDRAGWYSIRINDQRRLIFKVLKDNQVQVAGIKGMEDYH